LKKKHNSKPAPIKPRPLRRRLRPNGDRSARPTEYRERVELLGAGLKTAMAVLLKPTNVAPELIDFLGYDAAMQFMFCFGGRTMYVPKLSDIARSVHVATASVEVYERRMTEREAAGAYGVEMWRIRLVVDSLKRWFGYRTKMSKEVRELLEALDCY
jgi:hypothetical protein